jgi:four helix bundle protein
MTKNEQLRERTKQFAIRVIHLFRALPNATDAQIMGKQLLRSGTSVGANYRAVCRSRSKAEFISRLAVVTEEADESVFWLELIEETKVINPKLLEAILKEARELVAIFSASLKTARANK